MKKKVHKVFNVITISILLLMLIGIGGTYLSDYLVSINWFGDSEPYETQWGTSVDWGARHHWYNWGLGFLFMSALCRSIAHVIAVIDHE